MRAHREEITAAANAKWVEGSSWKIFLRDGVTYR
jgi:hypothetical protein